MRHAARFALLLLLVLTRGASAHRLDEYLQGTLIGLSRGSIDIEIQMVPGVAVLPAVLAVIDRDHDGQISAAEKQAYGERVTRDVRLLESGVAAKLTLLAVEFPPMDEMREGVGIIRIKLHARRFGQELRFENRHLPQLSVYLVNCLAAPEAGLAVTRQSRDEAQKSIQLDYSFASASLR